MKTFVSPFCCWITVERDRHLRDRVLFVIRVVKLAANGQVPWTSDRVGHVASSSHTNLAFIFRAEKQKPGSSLCPNVPTLHLARPLQFDSRCVRFRECSLDLFTRLPWLRHLMILVRLLGSNAVHVL